MMANHISREEYEASEERASEARAEIFKQLGEIKAMLLPIVPVLQIHQSEITDIKKKSTFSKRSSGARLARWPYWSFILGLFGK